MWSDLAKTLTGISCALLVGVVIIPGVSQAQNYASPERTAIAVGHYARARALLVEALAEFESGREIARPDVLIDAEEWRLSVVSRTEELNRLLDPQPRVTRSGVQFKANKALIRRERDRLPPGDYTAQDSNTYGEEQRRSELSASTKTPAVEPSAASVKTTSASDISPSGVGASTSPSHPRGLLSNTSDSSVDAVETSRPAPQKTPLPAIVKEDAVASANIGEIPQEAQESGLAQPTRPATDEDAEISQAIEQAIKARLEKMTPEGKNSGDAGTSDGQLTGRGVDGKTDTKGGNVQDQ